VWVSGAPWRDDYASYGVHAGNTGQGVTHWTLDSGIYGRMSCQTPEIGIYEEGAPIKPPRKVKCQTRAWKYIAGKWDRFYQD